jgi:hypothetical protein
MKTKSVTEADETKQTNKKKQKQKSRRMAATSRHACHHSASHRIATSHSSPADGQSTLDDGTARRDAGSEAASGPGRSMHARRQGILAH